MKLKKKEIKRESGLAGFQRVLDKLPGLNKHKKKSIPVVLEYEDGHKEEVEFLTD